MSYRTQCASVLANFREDLSVLKKSLPDRLVVPKRAQNAQKRRSQHPNGTQRRARRSFSTGSPLPGNSVNKVYRRKLGGRRVPLSENKNATTSEDATANAPAATLVADGGPATTPPEASGASPYFG